MEAASIFATKPVRALVAESEEGGLRRAIGLLDLTALGVGAIIGTGIFVIIGEAIGLAGPAIAGPRARKGSGGESLRRLSRNLSPLARTCRS